LIAVQISVIIPTHNRPDKLAATVACLKHQGLAPSAYEIIVVDDGSKPPVVLPAENEGPAGRLVRLEGEERSAARNAGAAVARGDLLVFVDDDMALPPDFLQAHLDAHRAWPDAMLAGAIRLSREDQQTPFGRFRDRLEMTGIPMSRGPIALRNFCAAGNMAAPRERFRALGGFDPALVSAEDQDLALRHTAESGRIVFVPEAAAIHQDSALDVRSYCRRAEWGMVYLIPFCRRHPQWPDNIERDRINGRTRWGQEPVTLSLRKCLKAMVAFRPITAWLLQVCSLLERYAPQSWVLGRFYQITLGAHIFRGYRKGLRHHR
jgi:GT2 family glycosyltransferase